MADRYLVSTGVWSDTNIWSTTSGGAGSYASPRVGTTTSGSTITININSYDQYDVTALAANATIAAPTGTKADGRRILLRIKDNGTSRSLTWNSVFNAIAVALPTSTTASKTIYAGFIYNSANSKWDVLSVGQEV